MARTPMLRRFLALAEDFEEANRTGRSVDVVQEERQKLRLTRRDFLKATGATFGAAAFAGPVAALGSTRRPSGTQGRIGIIGGGTPRPNAALALQGARLTSTVYGAPSPRG